MQGIRCSVDENDAFLTAMEVGFMKYRTKEILAQYVLQWFSDENDASSNISWIDVKLAEIEVLLMTILR